MPAKQDLSGAADGRGRGPILGALLATVVALCLAVFAVLAGRAVGVRRVAEDLRASTASGVPDSLNLPPVATGSDRDDERLSEARDVIDRLLNGGGGAVVAVDTFPSGDLVAQLPETSTNPPKSGKKPAGDKGKKDESNDSDDVALPGDNRGDEPSDPATNDDSSDDDKPEGDDEKKAKEKKKKGGRPQPNGDVEVGDDRGDGTEASSQKKAADEPKKDKKGKSKGGKKKD